MKIANVSLVEALRAELRVMAEQETEHERLSAECERKGKFALKEYHEGTRIVYKVVREDLERLISRYE